MKEKPQTDLDLAHATERPASFGKRLARLRKGLINKITGKHYRDSKQQLFWFSILTRDKENECPARCFQQTARSLRVSQNLIRAEEICNRGVALFPLDLPLALEHAEIAKASTNHSAGTIRWQRVLELSGNIAPLCAFRNLADCYRTSGHFNLAESVVRKGLELHPSDFSLMEKLAVLLIMTGAPSAALAAFRSLIEIHPDQSLEITYLRMGQVLANEGLLLRSTEVLQEGLIRYPSSVKLHDRLNEIFYLKETRAEPELDIDLFHKYLNTTNRGTLCFLVGHNALKQYIPTILSFGRTIAPPDVPKPLPDVDVFAVWGGPNAKQKAVCDLAGREGKLLLYLDSGFISSLKIEGDDHSAHSVIACPNSSYSDATQPSFLETKLNSNDYFLTDEQHVRAESVMASLVSNQISKFNHAPRTDLRTQFPADGTHRILLVDQKKDGGSIHGSLGGPSTFVRMLDEALARRDVQVLLKLHPEVISGRCQSSLRQLLPNPLPKNLVLIDYDVNPFDLFAVVDEIFVCCSQLGFEAVMAGKRVHCFAAPFYAGWGFTTDHSIIPRRARERTPSEIFHLFYIEHSSYFVPEQGATTIENLISYFVTSNDSSNEIEVEPQELQNSLPSIRDLSEPLRILIIIPSGRYGATGRYLQNLSISLIQLSCEVLVLAEGVCPTLESGVRWMTLEFDGIGLTDAIRREIIKFAPHFIYENGVRSRAQRAALEAMILTGARFVMQSEDDDIQVHRHRRGDDAADQLSALDHADLSTEEIAKFLRGLDWNHSLCVLFDPRFDRWIEPLLRVLCYRLACFHTAIWHPFAERLAREYAVPTLVVPPVASAADFERIPMTPHERADVLRHYQIDPTAVVIFIAGALYTYSDEYAIFLTALNLAANQSNEKYALVVTSGRSSLPLERMAAERLDPCVSFTDIGVATDPVYTEMLKTCDVVCSPGLPDDFNRYRLPSRLVKAMAMAKPILTCRCGFGESLENNHNAFLTEGNQPANWAAPITACLDPIKRAKVGLNGRIFAEQHFASNRVAAALKMQFEAVMEQTIHQLSNRIALHSTIPTPGQTLRPPNVLKI